MLSPRAWKHMHLFTHSFIHLFTRPFILQMLLSLFHVPGTVLGIIIRDFFENILKV